MGIRIVKWVHWPALALAVVAWALVGCDDFDNPPPELSDEGPVVEYFLGAGVGEACETDGECRDGLECNGSGACEPSGKKKVNAKCLLTAECSAATKSCTPAELSGIYKSGDANQKIACLGLHCGWAGFCVLSDSFDPDAYGADGLPGQLLNKVLNGKPGAPCASASECERGLFCDFRGLGGVCTQPEADAGDLGIPCEGTKDCLAGLACSAASLTCVPGSILLNPDLFMGETRCDEIEEQDEMPFGVRTVVRRGDEDFDLDFYSMPFPSDVLLDDSGHPDLSQHPRPGSGLIGFDPIGAVIAAIEEEMTGWSTQAGVYFRFTRPVNTDSLEDRIRFVNLDHPAAGSPASEHPFEVQFTAERNKYICSNYLLVHPLWSKPLRPKTTYGVVLTKGIESTDDEEEEGFVPEQATQLDDLAALLGATEPSDPDVRRAWERHEKLRLWLSKVELTEGDIVGATVFTTNNPTALMAALRAAVYGGEAVELAPGPVIHCKPGAQSICATPAAELALTGATKDPRACSDSETSGYAEYHGRIRVPIMQEGARPYLTEGGSLHQVGGAPAVWATEAVCASLTVPLGTMPAAGWPLMIYGHGTNGSFRTAPTVLGEFVGTVPADGKGLAQIAMLGIDGPMHADRRGQGPDSKLDPGPLFYNFANPKAAKGNFYQGAADLFALTRFATELAGVELLAGGGLFQVNPERIAYHGHSQGGATGPLVAPYESNLQTMVLSGTGGSLVFGLLGKKEPYDISTAMMLALQEVSLDDTHPALHLLQYYFDEVDATPYGPLLDDPPSTKGISMLHVYGHGDSFTPPETSRIYAASTGGDLATPNPLPSWFDPIDDLGMSAAELPITANRQVGGQAVTRVTTEALNDPANANTLGEVYDGHFVIYKDRTASWQFLNWMGTWALTGTPTVTALPAP